MRSKRILEQAQELLKNLSFQFIDKSEITDDMKKLDNIIYVYLDI